MRLLSVEGCRLHLDGGAMFGNAPKELWKRWIEPDPLNRIPIACRSLLAESESGKRILFDVGTGAFFEPDLKSRFGVEPEEHLLLSELRRLGIEEEEIDAVVLSHLHFDHAGGLLPAYPEPPDRLLFPHARYYVGARHWQAASNPHLRERASFLPRLHELLKESGRLVLLSGESSAELPLPVRFRYCSGHTEGLMLSIVGEVAFASDLIPGLPWMRRSIAMGYDRFPERSCEEKEEFLSFAFERELKLFFTHDPTTAFAAIERDERGGYIGRGLPGAELRPGASKGI